MEADKRKLVEASSEVMRLLRDDLGDSVGLAALVHDEACGEVLAKAEAKSVLGVTFEVGFHFVLHASAPGKALLAFQPETELDDLLSHMELKPLTAETITDVQQFREALDDVRVAGYAIDQEEAFPGCHCIAAPVLDGGLAVAAIWISAFSNRMPVDAFPNIGQTLRQAAAAISEQLSSADMGTDGYSREVIAESKRFFAENLDKTVDFEQYAVDHGVSYSWFRSKFKELTGESLKQFQLRLRMERAQRLLSHTDLSIKEIALQTGCDTANYFSNLFHRKMGITPTEYREQHRM